MPYTKRFPIKGSSNKAIEYILNEKKTTIEYESNYTENLSREFDYISNENKTWTTQNLYEPDCESHRLCTGINCHWENAEKEFYLLSKKYGNENDNIQAYHTIQSFSWNDNVNELQVHSMGIKLAKKLYPNYQCVVTTHCDRGHLHNHIICNATNLEGKKLRDDFYSSSTSLMKLRETSDKIAMNYHCHIIKDASLFGDKDKKQAYINSMTLNEMENLKKDIDEIKTISSSLNDVLRFLSVKGYKIKHGKYISICSLNTERYKRLDSLGKGYTEQELKTYFANKNIDYITDETLNQYIENNYGEIGISLSHKRDYSIESIKKTQAAIVDKPNKKYKTLRQKALEEIQRLNEDISLLNEFKIYNFEDLNTQIKDLENEIQASETYTIFNEQELTNNYSLLQNYELYLKTYNIYKTENDESIPLHERVLSPSSKLFEQIDRELNHPDIQTVRENYLALKNQEIEISKEIAKMSFKEYQLNRLYQLRNDALVENERFIKSIEFSEKMICNSPHDDQTKKEKEGYLYVRLPYTNYYTYVLKDSLGKNKYGRYQYYIIPDDQYTLFNEEGKSVHTIEAEDMLKLVESSKKKIDSSYAKRDDPTNRTDNFIFTCDIKLLHEYNEDYIFIKIPTKKEYIKVPKNHIEEIKKNKTYQITVKNNENIESYSLDGEYKNLLTISDLKKEFEEREKVFQKVKI